jgi:hypothetical protein
VLRYIKGYKGNVVELVTIGIVIVALVALGLGFFGLFRSWQLRWGATREEIVRNMPGDEVVPHPTFNATRAVAINAQPEDIWPWIVQIGFGRGGWYTWDFLDNLGHHSAERIVPEFQHIQVGDLIPLGPGANSGMRVKGFVVDRWILWWDKKNELTTWIWTLEPMSDGTTRLVTRVRLGSSWRHPVSAVWLLLVEVADFPMMRKCLLNIKRRAEVLALATVSKTTPTFSSQPMVALEEVDSDRRSGW